MSTSPKSSRSQSSSAQNSQCDPSAIHEHFDKEGYVIVPGILKPEVLAEARREMEILVDECAEKLMAEGRVKDPLTHEPFETRLYKLYADNLDVAPDQFRARLHRAGLFEVFFNPCVLDLVEKLLGPEIRLYPNYTVRPKFPEWEGTKVLWHQDGGYTEQVNSTDGKGTGGATDRLRMVNVWASLVPATVENGCMQFVPGTHKLGVVPHVDKGRYLEIAEEVLSPLRERAVNVEMQPGDVVFFNNLLFHQGLSNTAGTIRWSMDWRYQDATQDTQRKERGHLARSRQNPEKVVSSSEEWAGLSFG